MTTSLFRSLGGWTPDHQAQKLALQAAATSIESASAQLEALSVPEPTACAQRLAELSRVVPESHLDQLVELLALSPDPPSAARALETLFEQPDALELGSEALAAFVSLSSQSRFQLRM